MIIFEQTLEGNKRTTVLENSGRISLTQRRKKQYKTKQKTQSPRQEFT